MSLKIRPSGCGQAATNEASFDMSTHTSQTLRNAINATPGYIASPNVGIAQPATELSFFQNACPFAPLGEGTAKNITGLKPG